MDIEKMKNNIALVEDDEERRKELLNVCLFIDQLPQDKFKKLLEILDEIEEKNYAK